MCGKGGAPTTSLTTQNQNVQYTPYSQPLLADIYNRAQTVASQPYTPYTGELVAPLNGYQYGGINQVMDSAQLAQPYIQQGSGQVGAGSGMISSAQNYLPMASGYTQNAAQGVGNIGANDISQYMNPYQSQVIQATLANMAENNAQQQQQVQGNAAMRGALGGDRVGVAQAELARQQALANNQTLSGLNAQNYQQATQTALTQQQNQQANQARMLAAGSQLGGLGATQAGIGTQLAGSGVLQGNLGLQAQQAGITGGQSLLGAGSVPQQNQQALDTANYQQYLQQLAYPYQQTQFLSGIGLPAAGAMGGFQSQIGQSNQILTPPGMSWQQALVGGGALLGGLLGVKTGGRIPQRFAGGGGEDSFGDDGGRSHDTIDGEYSVLSDALNDPIVPESKTIIIPNSRPTPMASMTGNVSGSQTPNTNNTTSALGALGSLIGSFFDKGGRVPHYDSDGSLPILNGLDTTNRFPYPAPNNQQAFPAPIDWNSLSTHGAAQGLLDRIGGGGNASPTPAPGTGTNLPPGSSNSGLNPNDIHQYGYSTNPNDYAPASVAQLNAAGFAGPSNGLAPMIPLSTPDQDFMRALLLQRQQYGNINSGAGGYGGEASYRSGGPVRFMADGGAAYPSQDIGDNPYSLRYVKGAIPSMRGIDTPKVHYGDLMQIRPALDIRKAASSSPSIAPKDMEKLGDTASRLISAGAEEEASGGRIRGYYDGGATADYPGWEGLFGPDIGPKQPVGPDYLNSLGMLYPQLLPGTTGFGASSGDLSAGPATGFSGPAGFDWGGDPSPGGNFNAGKPAAPAATPSPAATPVSAPATPGLLGTTSAGNKGGGAKGSPGDIGKDTSVSGPVAAPAATPAAPSVNTGFGMPGLFGLFGTPAPGYNLGNPAMGLLGTTGSMNGSNSGFGSALSNSAGLNDIGGALAAANAAAQAQAMGTLGSVQGLGNTDAGGNLGGGPGGGTGISGPGAVGFGMGPNGLTGLGLGLGGAFGGQGLAGTTSALGGPGLGNNGAGRTGNGFSGFSANPGNFGLGLGGPGLGANGGALGTGFGGFGGGGSGFDSGTLGPSAGGFGFSNDAISGNLFGDSGGAGGGFGGFGDAGGFGGGGFGGAGSGFGGGTGFGGGGFGGGTGGTTGGGAGNQGGGMGTTGSPGDMGNDGPGGAIGSITGGDKGSSDKGGPSEGGKGGISNDAADPVGGMVSAPGFTTANASLDTSGGLTGLAGLGLAGTSGLGGGGGGFGGGLGGDAGSAGGPGGMGGTTAGGGDIGMGGSDTGIGAGNAVDGGGWGGDVSGGGWGGDSGSDAGGDAGGDSSGGGGDGGGGGGGGGGK